MSTVGMLGFYHTFFVIGILRINEQAAASHTSTVMSSQCSEDVLCGCLYLCCLMLVNRNSWLGAYMPYSDACHCFNSVSEWVLHECLCFWKSFDHLYIYSCIYYCSVDLGCLDLHWKNPSRNRILEGWDLGMERHLIVLLCPKTLYYSCQELDHRDFCMGFRCVVTL